MRDHSALIVAQQPRGIAFDEWRGEVALAKNVGEVVSVVRAYFKAWKPEELNALQKDLGDLAIETPADLIATAVLANRAEVMAHSSANSSLLREVSLMLAAAATRIRRLAGAA